MAERKPRKKTAKKEETKKLDPKDFFEWKLKLADIAKARLTKELETVKFANQVKDVELTKLKAQILELRTAKVKESLSTHDDAVKKAEKDYQEFRRLLEDRLDINLANSAVNELTYEIVSLEDNE